MASLSFKHLSVTSSFHLLGVTNTPYLMETCKLLLAVTCVCVCVWDGESRRVTELYLAGLLCSLCEDRGWWNQVSRCLSAFKLAPLWAALLSFRAGEICALLTPHQEKLQHRRLKTLYSVLYLSFSLSFPLSVFHPSISLFLSPQPRFIG